MLAFPVVLAIHYNTENLMEGKKEEGCFIQREGSTSKDSMHEAFTILPIAIINYTSAPGILQIVITETQMYQSILILNNG